VFPCPCIQKGLGLTGKYIINCMYKLKIEKILESISTIAAEFRIRGKLFSAIRAKYFLLFCYRPS
jgi:hypothetical protein